MGDHGPDMTTLETVVPAVLGLAAAAILAAVCICVRKLRARNKKAAHHEAALPFQPARRPTAVRSPSGAPPHYLKKSPSPTAPKPPPGTLQASQEQSSSPPHHTIKYSEGNDMTAKMFFKETELESPNGCGDAEYGKLGSIVFKLRYLMERNALVVSIVRCRGLPGKPGPSGTGDIPVGMNGKTQTATDPYVKLQLLPEKQHKVKTRVVRNTRNPVYDEDFTFYGLNLHDLGSVSLHFVILSFDRYSRDDVIGEVICPLSSIDLNQLETQQIALSKEIQPRSLKIRAQGRGELLISLCWQPAAARLTVVLLKARNLPRMDVTGLADPYVKLYLLYNGQRIAKKKTHVKKRTLSPVFNESFAFDIPTTEGNGASLDGVSLELMLLDWDRVTKNELRRKFRLLLCEPETLYQTKDPNLLNNLRSLNEKHFEKIAEIDTKLIDAIFGYYKERLRENSWMQFMGLNSIARLSADLNLVVQDVSEPHTIIGRKFTTRQGDKLLNGTNYTNKTKSLTFLIVTYVEVTYLCNEKSHITENQSINSIAQLPLSSTLGRL